mmetsp:Transcript_4904/g.6348  ORF Transcript_4904/g.6348 Transcript_4904/m.6348 type:complete len:561 (+) Transcript_4904:73-1755(+)
MASDAIANLSLEEGQEEEPSTVDEYTDDNDPGYVVLDVTDEEFHRLHKEAMDNITKARTALPKGAEEALASEVSRQPKLMRFDNGEVGWMSEDAKQKSAAGGPTTPRTKSIGFEGVARDQEERAVELRKKSNLTCFQLKVIHEPMRTGFEVDKDFVPERDMLVAGRFQVEEFLGEAAFSTAIQCKDLASENEKEPDSVCLKIIKNNKDYFDQSLDEIKLLHFINSRGDPEKFHILRMIDYFYYKEHLFLVTELLKDNLYEYSRYIRHSGAEPYFTIPRLKSVMRQLLEAVAYIHSLNLIHCDIKPENILIQSYSQVKVKLIDFGSSCFTTDYLNSYVQSRSYRAPEVILGLPYGPKIDIWSLGTVAAELFTGNVLFQNQSVPTMLIRMTSILGPVPVNMLLLGTAVNKYFLSGKMVFERAGSKGTVTIMRAKKTSIKHRLHTEDEQFVDFVSQLLQYDQTKRPSALEALRHPFLNEEKDGSTTAELFEQELRNAGNSDTGRATPASQLNKKSASSETGRVASKKPPQRLKSTKGKVVAKPEKPRINNATKKARMKPGASF